MPSDPGESNMCKMEIQGTISEGRADGWTTSYHNSSAGVPQVELMIIRMVLSQASLFQLNTVKLWQGLLVAGVYRLVMYGLQRQLCNVLFLLNFFPPLLTSTGSHPSPYMFTCRHVTSHLSNVVI